MWQTAKVLKNKDLTGQFATLPARQGAVLDRDQKGKKLRVQRPPTPMPRRGRNKPAQGSALGHAPKGPQQASPGQRPGRCPEGAATSQPRAAPWEGELSRSSSPERAQQHPEVCFALSGLDPIFERCPRAMPWAVLFQPFRLKRGSVTPNDPGRCPGLYCSNLSG